MPVSIWAPIGYIGFLLTALWTFSKVYRRRQANQPAPAPWFPQHKSRDIYISLLSMDPIPPRQLLIAALLRRAMDDVRLIWSIRDAKAALNTLLQRGQIGDELWERFLTAEKELEAEIVEVVGEANTFQEGYGNQIFGIASEMVSHERWKEVYTKIPAERAAEKARMAAGVPSLVLAPHTYLTPSSLTLAPSNPVVVVETVDVPSPTIAAPVAVPAISPPAPRTPVKAAVAPSPAPPSRQLSSASQPSTPPPGLVDAAPDTLPVSPPSAPGSVADSDGSEAVQGSTPSTPGSAKKSNKKKKKSNKK